VKRTLRSLTPHAGVVGGPGQVGRHASRRGNFYQLGASTLGEAYDMLEQLELSNDVPEILGHTLL
jgi:hypothetical protein